MKDGNNPLLKMVMIHSLNYNDILSQCIIFHYRSLKYEINDRHVFSIPVYAVVKELSLQLSSNVINLCEQTFAHINAGTMFNL